MTTNIFKKDILRLSILLLIFCLPFGSLRSRAADTARVAVILPFKSGGESGQKSIAFYRGFLLAAEHLKISGISAHITAHNEGNVGTLLTPTLEAVAPKADALVGFAYAGHDTEAADFARRHEMPVFLPFISRIPPQIAKNPFAALPFPDDEAWAEETATLLMATLGRVQVMVMQSEATPISYRTQQLVNRLKRKGAKIKAMPISATPYDIAEALNKRTANLVVTAAMDNDILRNLAQKVRSIGQTHQKERVTMLVQPEWYEQHKGNSDSWNGMEAFVPIVHFSMPHAAETKMLTDSYKHWFNGTPNQASLTNFLTGYDMGIHIIGGLARHGRRLLQKNEHTKGAYLNISMKQSNESACYTNHAQRLLHIKNDGTVALISY